VTRKEKKRNKGEWPNIIDYAADGLELGYYAVRGFIKLISKLLD
jgi:hypothetical protein